MQVFYNHADDDIALSPTYGMKNPSIDLKVRYYQKKLHRLKTNQSTEKDDAI